MFQLSIKKKTLPNEMEPGSKSFSSFLTQFNHLEVDHVQTKETVKIKETQKKEDISPQHKTDRINRLN